MKRRIAAVAVAASCTIGASISVAATTAGANSARSSITRASSGCVYGRIEGNRKCLRAGEYCIHHQPALREYKRYGFSCSERDPRGNWHLERT